MDDLLRTPMNVAVQTDVPVPVAIARLESSLAERPRIEPATNTSSDRHLIGAVNDTGVQLSVWDANVVTRRKSWNIQFEGVFTSTPEGATLTGAISIPDRAQLGNILWMFRIAASLVVILAIGLDARDVVRGQAVVIWPVIGAIAMALAVGLGTLRMEQEGARYAEDDARLLTAAIQTLLVGRH